MESVLARRALIVGINEYDNFGIEGQLRGAVPDAKRVAELLCRHNDSEPNYDCMLITSERDNVTKGMLREALSRLFRGTNDEVLFYFAGHGAVTDSGGYIVTQDAQQGDVGILMDELLGYALNADEKESIIILDCCHSGHVGDPVVVNAGGAYQQSVLKQNTSILAASRPSEASMEISGQGIFTSLLADALEGGAADILGNVTLPSVYAHIEGALGPWEQRPIYKTYTSSVSVLRRAEPRIERMKLRRITELFPSPDSHYSLTPDYEYNETPQTSKQQIGHLFKQYRDAGLLATANPGQDL